MRVMFWCATYWPSIGGVQTMANELLPALSRRGCEFVVVAEQTSAKMPAEDEHCEIPIYRFPFTAGLRNVDNLAKIRKQVIRLKRTFAPDLCHITTLGTTDFYHHISAGACRTPALVSLHGVWPCQYAQFLVRTFGSADWLTCNSENTLEYARRLMPAISPRSSVIYNALEEPSLLPEPLPFDPPRLLYLGRLSPEKCVDLALDTLAGLMSQYPSAQLVIAGDGLERERLELRTTRLGLEDHVQFLGWVSSGNVPALINSATLLLLPSEQEAFGLAALEAAFMARPVVATHRGGLPEVIEHGATGLLVDKLDATHFGEAVSWLLEHPELASRMGKAARARARTVFDWEGCVDAYEALYKRLVRSHDKQLLEERHV